MTRQRWYLCASDENVPLIARAIMARADGAEVICLPSAQATRRALLLEAPGAASLVVGEGLSGVAPINLAAALVADGHADEVILVCDNPSGSLRSRASRAGIDEVLDLAALEVSVPKDAQDTARARGCRPHATASAGTGAERGEDLRAPALQPSLELADDDLDEPEGVEHPAMTAVPAVAAGTQTVLTPQVTGPHAPMLAFVSGRGGVGKTAVVATSALIAASWGLRVAVVDLDLAFGNLFGVLGLPAAADLSSVGELAPGEPATDAIMRCGRKVTDRVALWGPCERVELAETVQPRAAELLATLSSRYDLVLVDTSTTWGDAIAQAVQTCERLIIVGDQRAGAVSSLARAGSLAVRLGVARTRIMRLMNRCDSRRRDEGFLARADIGLECAQTLRVLDGGDEVAELLSAGLAGELAELECDFTESLSTALAQILSELGCLPDDDAAARALEGRRRARRGLFGRTREAS